MLKTVSKVVSKINGKHTSIVNKIDTITGAKISIKTTVVDCVDHYKVTMENLYPTGKRDKFRFAQFKQQSRFGKSFIDKIRNIEGVK